MGTPGVQHEGEEGSCARHGEHEQALRRADDRQQRPGRHAGHEEPDDEAGDDPGEPLLDLAYGQNAAGLAADHGEAELHRKRHEDLEPERDPRCVVHLEREPCRGDQDQERADHRGRHRTQRPSADRLMHDRHEDSADHRDGDVDEGERWGPVRSDEDARGRDHDESAEQSERQRLSGEHDDDSGQAIHYRLASRAASHREAPSARQRTTSAEITPAQTSG